MRCFISINFPEEVQKSIARAQSDLKSAVQGNFVKPENVHITLKFLGELSDSELESWKRRIKLLEFQPFKITLKGLSAFPKESFARVIFIETDAGRAEINEIERQLKHDKRFKPHATIVRVKKRDGRLLRDLFEKYMDEEFGSFTCNKISLMKSTLTPQGPIYEEL